MMKYLAHSAHKSCPEQSYSEHINNVVHNTLCHAKAAAKYSKSDGELLIQSAYHAALYHDMGKLHPDNQQVLHKPESKDPLPIPHQDAGVACLKKLQNSNLAQIAVYSHHKGLPNMNNEKLRQNNTNFRYEDKELRDQVNEELPELIEWHNSLTSYRPDALPKRKLNSDFSVFARIMLSCLVDADHTDTAQHYQNYPSNDHMPQLRARERLDRLNAYVDKLKSESERDRLRSEMFIACRDSTVNESIVFCDSPVGSGKTTAIMANLLQHAIKTNARRVFVVLPFTNIIKQSVDTYRKALVLPKEDPQSVVAELHHRADFEDENMRALSANWKAPIIVTTAVAFFETLAASRTASLRKLHELPGSVIFVDEAHASVPIKLLPVTLRWITKLADEWNCYWVLASGSLVKFWNIEELGISKRNVPQIVPETLRNKLNSFENHRIEYEFHSKRLSIDDLINLVIAKPGPRLVIMNTVKSAAVIAKALSEKCGKDQVQHISTALKPEDREKTIAAVKDLLDNKSQTDWTLVATSCVEAGMDFSFKTGFREISSLLSLLQAAGRINRNGKDNDAVIWSFQMRTDEPLIEANIPFIKDSAKILTSFFESGKVISPELSTEAVRCEMEQGSETHKKLIEDEKEQLFQEVSNNYHIIEDENILVIVDPELKQSILNGNCTWKEIQRKAVPLSCNKIKEYGVQQLAEGIYDWNLGYDSFLGIMHGALKDFHHE